MAPQTNKHRKEGRTTTTKQQMKEQMKCTIFPKQTIILQDIHNLTHLTEYQHLLSHLEMVSRQNIENIQFRLGKQPDKMGNTDTAMQFRYTQAKYDYQRTFYQPITTQNY
jgi:hypothetical protein